MSNPVKFPQIHIATSVVNRLLNLRDEINPAPTIPSGAPNVPNPTMEGATVQQQVDTPTPDVEAAGDVSDVLGQNVVGTLTQ